MIPWNRFKKRKENFHSKIRKKKSLAPFWCPGYDT